MKVYSEQGIIDIDAKGEEFKQFELIVAGGGVVLNGNGELLMIFRRGKWDLPKGKAEDNEPIELCAERETKEETGLEIVILQRYLARTYHTYVDKGHPILKETHWFLYKTDGVPPLVPQTNEDITEAKWIAPHDVHTYTSDTYDLIKDVLKEAELV